MTIASDVAHDHTGADPILSLVAAVADNRVIGRDNQLPWRLPADLAHFKRLTLDKPIVMGRRTWESLPGLLPRRRHIVLSRDPDYRAAGCCVASSLGTAITLLSGEPELMIVGGATLYAEAMPLAQRLYLTQVHTLAEGDVRFPDWDAGQWEEVSRIDRPADDKNVLDMTFLELRRLV